MKCPLPPIVNNKKNIIKNDCKFDNYSYLCTRNAKSINFIDKIL